MKRIAASLSRAQDVAPGILMTIRAGSVTCAIAAAFVVFGWSDATAAVTVALAIGFVVGWGGAREPQVDMAAQLEETRQRLDSLALRDPLTGVLNHRAFQDALETELRRARRESKPVSVVSIDIDGFRDINDSRGHAQGDATLVAVAEGLSSNLRPGDVCGRVGGDEFMLVLSGCDVDGAQEAMTRLRTGIDARAMTAAVGTVSISAGIAEFPRHSVGRNELMRFADTAMLRARQEKGGATEVHSADLVEADGDEDSARMRRSGLFNTVHALARAVDARDGFTHMHSQRVAFYAATIANAMNLGEERVENIRMAGLLHDVGKIGIRDAILLKPSPLTREEFAVMRRHSELGRAIIAGAGLNEIADWVGALHERIDADGYPDGLEGEHIPLESRILHVADALETMTCPRAYRDPKTAMEAVADLESHSGRQFDPEIVKVIAKLVRDGAVEVGEQPRLGHPMAGGVPPAPPVQQD